jgi:hypothetical protein
LISNEKYLRSHPEIQLLLKKATEQVLKDKPEQILPYIVEFFTRDDLKEFVLDEKKTN